MKPTVLTKNEDVATVVPPKKASEGHVKPDAPSANAPTVPSSKHEEENGDGDQWDDSNSLYEEFLDDTEAFEYPSGTLVKSAATSSALIDGLSRPRILHC